MAFLHLRVLVARRFHRGCIPLVGGHLPYAKRFVCRSIDWRSESTSPCGPVCVPEGNLLAKKLHHDRSKLNCNAALFVLRTDQKRLALHVVFIPSESDSRMGAQQKIKRLDNKRHAASSDIAKPQASFRAPPKSVPRSLLRYESTLESGTRWIRFLAWFGVHWFYLHRHSAKGATCKHCLTS